LPTYDLIAQIAYPRFQQLLIEHGYYCSLNESKKELSIVGMSGKVIFRTMDHPERIVGYEHADAVIDELDTLKTDKAADVWRKVVARNRQKKPDGSINTIAVATTPEGFKFVYDKWKRKPLNGSQIIKASTYSNAKNLPEDYISTLKDNYPDQMLLAYLDGEFVNLTQGSVILILIVIKIPAQQKFYRVKRFILALTSTLVKWRPSFMFCATVNPMRSANL
jgi:hypothetical protein